jgi:hypothetical protein
MRLFKIQRMKSEAPLIAAFAIFSIIVSLVFFPLILWFSFLVFPIMALSYLILRKFKLGLFRKECFLILDETGMRYCFHLFQQARILRWDQIEKANYQLYEINLKLKESGEIICIQTSYLEDPEELEALKKMVAGKCVTM